MLKIGVIGAGRYGLIHLQAFKDRELNVGDIKLAGFAELNSNLRAQREKEFTCKGYANYIELIENEKLDAVSIATPDHLHYDIAMACLDYKIPLLIEKPLATKINEAEGIVRKANANNVFVQVDFHKRFDPYHIDLKLRMMDKELGDLQYGNFWVEDVLDVGINMLGQDTWESSSSPVWFLGIHVIDLSLWLMDFPKPTEVYAKGFKQKLTSLGYDLYDSIKSTVTYDNGVTITYDNSIILPNSFESLVRQGIKLLGTEGIIELNTQYRGARYCTTAKGMETPNIGGYYNYFNKRGGVSKKGYYYEAIHDFVDNIKILKSTGAAEIKGAQLPSADEAIVSTKIGEAIHQSILENRVIKL